MSMPGLAGMHGHVRSGKLRALAVTGARRALLSDSDSDRKTRVLRRTVKH